MVVSSRDQRRPGGKAQRGSVVHVVAKAVVSESLEVGGLDRPSKGTGRAEAHIIRLNQQNVGRSRWSLDTLRKVGRRILHGTSDLSFEWRFRLRQYISVLRRRSAWERGRDCGRCNEGAGAKQMASGDPDLARGGRDVGLLV